MSGWIWCLHNDTIRDDEGYETCVKCCATFYNGPLRERDLWDAADAIWAKGYDGPGLPPSITNRLRNPKEGS